MCDKPALARCCGLNMHNRVQLTMRMSQLNLIWKYGTTSVKV